MRCAIARTDGWRQSALIAFPGASSLMLKPYSALRRFVTAILIPPLLVLRDLATHLARIVPEASDRVRFRRFWGDGSLLTDVYFVTDSYEGVALRNRFRFQEAMSGRGVLETLAGNTIVDGAFSPQAAAMLTALFLRHGENVLRVVTDAEASAGPNASLICYGTSDSNCKTFDVEARSGSSLCQFLMDANGQRAFRLGEQVFSMESRGGVIYDKAIVLRLTTGTTPLIVTSYVPAFPSGAVWLPSITSPPSGRNFTNDTTASASDGTSASCWKFPAARLKTCGK